MTAAPVARSARLIRRQMLRHNRFLGLHQLWFGLLLMPVITYGLALTFDPTGWWLVVPGFLASMLLVELAFLPRRVVIHRLSAKESHEERVREALRHGVSLQEVQVVDREGAP
ncbi:hypothetical protein [Halomonas getboli]|uniref:hypothetical protein n=1 Tax=Halomonas getboli TaxID=2935862 RepID=UPI001FFF252E|nr:hypothetical protein [Halomonas getboli]MCK2182978.1 hypothetical protein [Halomonas getboli]